MQEKETYQSRRAGSWDVCDNDVQRLHRRVIHAIPPDVEG